MDTMNQYSKGAKLFCDFPFGGKPKAVCISVEEPGNGKTPSGKIRVRLTETAGAYRKGEVLELDAVRAVPCKQEFRKRGSFHRWVNTNYQWI